MNWFGLFFLVESQNVANKRWPFQETSTSLLLLLVCTVAIGIGGCSPKDASRAQATRSGPSVDVAGNAAVAAGSIGESMTANTPPSLLPESTDPSGDTAGSLGVVGPAELTETATPVATVPRLELPPQLTEPRLIDFIKSLDIEMRNVASGKRQLFDPQEANTELNRLSRLKLEAAMQLQDRTAPASPTSCFAIRGQLQALSHLAGLGDLDSAMKLDSLARQHLESQDNSLAMDSLLVLVGLALEKLQNGTASDSQELLSLVDRIALAPESLDVSALMVLGQAHAVLRRYGDDSAAERVRDAILDRFVGHPNQAVAEMAIGFAGSPIFAEVEQVLRDFEAGEAVTIDRWKGVIETLLNDSPDVAGVRYLAGVSLQFEAYGNLDLAAATFSVITGFPGLNSDSKEEARIAADAYQARRAIIGQTVAIDLPSIDDHPLSLSSFSGRVILMPFWAVGIPDSLKILQLLNQVRREFDGQVEIVGMNLDDDTAPIRDFMSRSPIEFRSFRSLPDKQTGAHDIAVRFGVVSLPFIAIIDRQGRISAINLNGQRLSDQVRLAIEQ
jgi:thiol-disulfide isomerase/thioredoxin